MDVPPARNSAHLDGFIERGVPRCARKSIGNFATLVRKSYSNDLSLVSTLVTGNARPAFQANLGTPVGLHLLPNSRGELANSRRQAE